VEANVPKSQFIVSAFQLPPPVVTQRHARVIAADCVFPKVRERRRCFCQITEESQSTHKTCRTARRLSSAVSPYTRCDASESTCVETGYAVGPFDRPSKGT